MPEPDGPIIRTALANGHTVRAYDRELVRLRDLIIEMGKRPRRPCRAV
jgi:hypothetical protein